MKRIYLYGMVMALAALLCLGTVAQAQNLVVNGGFDDIDVNTVSNGNARNLLNQGWNAYPDGFSNGTTPLGWHVEWHDYSGDFGTCNYPPDGQPSTALLEIQTTAAGTGPVRADSNSQWAELDADWSGPFSGSIGGIYRNGTLGDCNAATTAGEPSPVRIYQDLNTALPGTYELKFAFAARTKNPNGSGTAENNHLQVIWNGEQVYNDSTTSSSWTQVVQEVTATTNPTRLEFVDHGFPDSYGTLLDSVVVTRVEGAGCTYTQGYWKTHSSYGPASSDPVWGELPQGPNTPFFNCGKTWYEILTAPPKKGNAFLILAHQYIAAYLNLLSGAASTDQDGNSIGLEEKMAEAQTLLSDTCTAPAKNDPLRQEFLDVAEFLNSYNTGSIGPGHCF
jgi:hypothetical protein